MLCKPLQKRKAFPMPGAAPICAWKARSSPALPKASFTGNGAALCKVANMDFGLGNDLFYIDPEDEEMKIAYPDALFDRSITDCRAMMTSTLTLSISHNPDTGDVDYGKICGICFPHSFLPVLGSSTGANVAVCTVDDSTTTVDILVYKSTRL